jgi:hypothetical protein
MSIGHFPLPLFLQLAKTNLYSSLRQATTVRRGISCSISKAQLMSDGIPGVAEKPTIRDERECGNMSLDLKTDIWVYSLLK